MKNSAGEADFKLCLHCLHCCIAVPEGCLIQFSQWVMHRHPRYFENPEVFQPERWSDDLEKRLPRGVYIPFGDGSRICIGKGFALMEAVLVLATIA